MNEIHFASRKTQRDFHWAWYLVPGAFGTVAIVLVSAVVLLSRILSMMPCEGPAPRIAANAVPTTVVVPEPGPALAAEPVAGWPSPAAAGETETEEQPPTF